MNKETKQAFDELDAKIDAYCDKLIADKKARKLRKSKISK